MLGFKEWKSTVGWNGRKVHKGLSLLGGLVGFIAATGILYVFAISSEFDIRLLVFAVLPLVCIAWFSRFDKRRDAKKDTEWDFGRTEQRSSKFDKPIASLDLFGTVLGIILSYFSIYLSEVLTLVRAFQEQYPQEKFFPLFLDIFTNMLQSDWASLYLWRYWILLTILLVCGLGGGALFSYIHSKRHLTPGRKLTEEEQAKLAYGAVLFTRNGLSYEYLLGMLSSGKMRIQDGKKMLAESWDIYNKEYVQQTVSTLLSLESKESFDQVLLDIRKGEAKEEDLAIYEEIKRKFIEHYDYTEKEIESISTFSAWNYDRLVNLVRYAYIARYITEEEMWDFIDQTIPHAKADYQTWRQYFAAIIIARCLFWGGNFDHNRVIAMKLLNNPNSIYNKYPL